jgi:hypothetical protein
MLQDYIAYNYPGDSGVASAPRTYRASSVKENEPQRVNLRMASIFENAQEPSDILNPENSQEHTGVVGSFVSVFEDAEFSQTLIGSADIYPSSLEESDPFHSDWPYWDHTCG